jgi:DNA-binding NtrC family response regulator
VFYREILVPLAVVVEDEWLIRAEIVEALMDAGWKIEEMASGEQALEFLKRDIKIAFLVTDIQVGDHVSGWDVAEAYLAANPGLKVVYCSANVPMESRKVANSMFLPKPCRMDMILRAAAAA